MLLHKSVGNLSVALVPVKKVSALATLSELYSHSIYKRRRAVENPKIISASRERCTEPHTQKKLLAHHSSSSAGPTEREYIMYTHTCFMYYGGGGGGAAALAVPPVE
jgi:hypothetical protein